MEKIPNVPLDNITTAVDCFCQNVSSAFDFEMSKRPEALQESLKLRLKAISGLQTASKTVKGRLRGALLNMLRVAKCPMVGWTREYVLSNPNNKYSNLVNDLDAFLLLPSIFKTLQETPYILRPTVQVIFLCIPFFSPFIDSHIGTEQLEEAAVTLLREIPDEAHSAIQILFNGYAADSFKARRLLELAMRVLLGRGQDDTVAMLKRITKGKYIHELEVYLNMHYSQKEFTVSVADGNTLVTFEKKKDNLFTLQEVSVKKKILSMIEYFIQQGRLIVDPNTGYGFISASQTEEQVVEMAKIYQVAICTSTPVFRIGSTESDYARVNETLKQVEPVDGCKQVKYHQRFMDAINQVTSDITAFYFWPNVRRTTMESSLPRLFVDALLADNDAHFHYNHIVYKAVHPLLRDADNVTKVLWIVEAKKDFMKIEKLDKGIVIVRVNDKLTVDEYAKLVKELKLASISITGNNGRYFTFSTTGQRIDIRLPIPAPEPITAASEKQTIQDINEIDDGLIDTFGSTDNQNIQECTHVHDTLADDDFDRATADDGHHHEEDGNLELRETISEKYSQEILAKLSKVQNRIDLQNVIKTYTDMKVLSPMTSAVTAGPKHRNSVSMTEVADTINHMIADFEYRKDN